MPNLGNNVREIIKIFNVATMYVILTTESMGYKTPYQVD